MHLFIKVIEVWKPSRRGSHLELEAGIYGELTELQWESERSAFEFGRGLPGQAWAQRRAIMLTELQEPYFRRAAEARRAGLEVAVAIPVFQGDFLGGVVVMLCGGGMAGGAVEVWTASEDGSTALQNGYYGALESLKSNSEGLAFGPGQGLPGVALAKGLPVLASPLSSVPAFARRQSVEEVAVTTGVALPVCADSERASVVVLLSALHTPIAESFEIWKPDRAKNCLRLHESYEGGAEYQQLTRDITIAPGEGILGRAWVTGQPVICTDLGQEKSHYAHWACAEGLRTACAIPFGHEGRLGAVLTLAR